jgi:hypothetical protein
MDVLLFVVPLALVPLSFFIVLSLLLPSVRWVFGVIVVIAIGFASLWIQHVAVTSAPDYRDGAAGAAFGVALVGLATMAFIIAVILYTAGVMWLQSRDEERRQTANNKEMAPPK